MILGYVLISISIVLLVLLAVDREIKRKKFEQMFKTQRVLIKGKEDEITMLLEVIETQENIINRQKNLIDFQKKFLDVSNWKDNGNIL